MVSSLKATVEHGTYMEPTGVDPNALDDEDSDLDSRACQLDNQIRNLEPNLWYMLPRMILRTARPQL